MNFRFYVTGARELTANLIGLEVAARGTKLEAAGIAGGNIIAEDAARRAPKDTGRAAKSIMPRIVRTEPHEVEIAIGPGRFEGWYLLFPEIGTSKMRARPFLRPAFDLNKNRAIDEARRVFRSNILSALRRSG